MLSISFCKTRPPLETVPALKTTEYPWETGSYKPLCHARLVSVENEGLLCDIAAFQRNGELGGGPLSGDLVAVSLGAANGETVLTAVSRRDGRLECYVNGQPLETELSADTYAGEDEQGWYWGVRFALPLPLLQDVLGVVDLSVGSVIKCNIYIFSNMGSDVHIGAVFPPTDKSLFSYSNLGELTVAPY